MYRRNTYLSRTFFIFVVLLPFIASTISCKEKSKALADGLYAEMDTSQGKILLSLYYDKAPLTVMNFVGLAEGKFSFAKPEGRFYDGLLFHRVIENFMIQGGDPQGNGTGGPGYQFPDEFDEGLLFDREGILAMANSGPQTNGSQFFITHVPTPWLQNKHSIFGQVIEGQDVVNSISQGDKINTVNILRVGAKAKAFTVSDQAFEKMKEQVMEESRIEKEAASKKIQEEISQRWPDAMETSSGIRYVIKREGTGSPPPKGAKVKLHYTGSFLDGKVFDSSRERNALFEFSVGMGQVIPGWDEMVGDMKQNEHRIIILPPETAYGSQGAGGVIPPNAWLVFDVEMFSFELNEEPSKE